MNSAASHILIASNPKSGAASRDQLVCELNASLNQSGFQSQIISDLKQLEIKTKQLTASGDLHAVVAAGGDGTVALLANLLCPATPILIFPLGTENLLAKHLGLSADVRSATASMIANEQTVIDVGSANGKLFLVMASVGFDAEVVRQMTQLRTGHISRFSYARPIASALWKYSFPKLRVTHSQPNCEASAVEPNTNLVAKADADKMRSPCSIEAAWMFLFNVPRYAAALNFCPQADPADGLLDLCTFARPGVGWGLGYLLRLAMGNHQSMVGFDHRLCSELVVASGTDRHGTVLEDIPFQLDGDFGGVLPLTVKVIRNRLRLIVGAR